ncbi:MAG TPA: hypothetical protein VFN48_02990 [Solirubrobacteraceae bacterium]|nr:hypothetical protein [Solirubrobacteraceae bacterium]
MTLTAIINVILALAVIVAVVAPLAWAALTQTATLVPGRRPGRTPGHVGRS